MGTVSFLRTFWGDHPKGMRKARVESAPWFRIRGMIMLYGRIDCFPKTGSFNMDLWQNRKGGIFMRCWSRISETDDEAYEVFGWNPTMPEQGLLHEDEIPIAVKKAYADWVDREF